MAGLTRTLLLTLGVGGFLAACGHLPFTDIPDAEDGGGLEPGRSRTPRSVTKPRSSTPASTSWTAACVGPTCPGTYVSAATGKRFEPRVVRADPCRRSRRASRIAVALGGAQSVYVAGASLSREGHARGGGGPASAATDLQPATSCTLAARREQERHGDPRSGLRGCPRAEGHHPARRAFDGFRVAGQERRP